MVLAAAAALSACGSAAPWEGTETGGGCNAGQLIIVNCSGCHDGTEAESGALDLRAPDSVAALVGQPARGAKCAATQLSLLNPDGGGLFVEKLGPAPPCGDRMPQGTYPLSPDEMACVESWLDALAANSR
jgi:hypothetical protein